MEVLHLRDEYIKLGQAMKAAGLAGSGVEAKEVIQDGEGKRTDGYKAGKKAVRRRYRFIQRGRDQN